MQNFRLDRKPLPQASEHTYQASSNGARLPDYELLVSDNGWVELRAQQCKSVKVMLEKGGGRPTNKSRSELKCVRIWKRRLGVESLAVAHG